MTRILIVDDEKFLVKGLCHSLKQEGYEVLTAYDGLTALELIEENQIDLIILDIMLPKMNGLEVCREIRKNKETPIIMLTAKGEDVDKIIGLELGADDYLAKPFNTRELLARIKAVLKRTKANNSNDKDKVVRVKPLEINGSRRKVTVDGQPVELTSKEFDLLYLLARHPGRVYTRENLLDLVWGSHYYSDLRTVDVHVRRIREKIEKVPNKPELILTKWGVGYYFKEF
ncbi:response regulator transcription factor [Desulfolucanica intricata]|uniref:response regulator transcription factor n=1 Tax=Desulfolucanica intricata TaxID=1285191 RepID=UPI00082DBA7F|nr:response regulator transcription factor [Desulfolucanica intricata]